MPGAAVDCEQILDAFLRQPANALTSLAFIAAGIVVARRVHRGWIPAALIATGVGSFLFHGPMPPGSQWAHDVSLTWLLVTTGTADTRWETLGGWPALTVLGVLLWFSPAVADPAAAVAAVAAIGAIVWRAGTARTFAALGLLGLGAVVGRLSATGGPWCEPESILQGHSFWHLAAATAVALWAGPDPRSSDQNGPSHGPFWS